MGISQRKEREKEDLKRSILDAAKELFLEKGYDQTSIRNIAEKIEYSPTTIYLYFKDKDAIFHELHDEAFLMMKSKFTVLQYISNPFDRLKAMGKIYLDFAMENKELYDLMFILDAPMKVLQKEDCPWDEGKDSFKVLEDIVRDCIKDKSLPEGDPTETAFFIWSAVHGMSSLIIRNRCLHVVEESKQSTILQDSYKTMFNILECFKRK
jgi:AcrR family transcriptional regulator